MRRREPSLMLVDEIHHAPPVVINPIRGKIDIESFLLATTKQVNVAIGEVVLLSKTFWLKS